MAVEINGTNANETFSNVGAVDFFIQLGLAYVIFAHSGTDFVYADEGKDGLMK